MRTLCKTKAGVAVPKATRLHSRPAVPARRRRADAIRRHVGALQRHAVGSLLDPQAIHDLRVTCRRLRAALDAMAPAGDPATDRARKALAGLTRCLGAVRDFDVFLAAVRHDLGSLAPGRQRALAPLLARWRRARQRRYHRLAVTLQSPAFPALLQTLKTLSARLQAPAALTGSPAGDPLPARLRRLLKRTRRLGQPMGRHTPDDRLHRLRICCKKLRYACECLDASGNGPVAGFVRRAARLQDVLGHHQDLALEAGLLRNALDRPATARAPARRKALRDLLARVTRVKAQSHRACLKAWRKFDRHPARRALLKRLR